MSIDNSRRSLIKGAGALPFLAALSALHSRNAHATTVTDYSLGSTLSFDIDFASLSSVTLNFSLESADFSGDPLTFKPWCVS